MSTTKPARTATSSKREQLTEPYCSVHSAASKTHSLFHLGGGSRLLLKDGELVSKVVPDVKAYLANCPMAQEPHNKARPDGIPVYLVDAEVMVEIMRKAQAYDQLMDGRYALAA